jgi:hypothetical protein
LVQNATNEYISKCAYQANIDTHCPVFLLGKILKEAEPNESERAQMLKTGAVIHIDIEWNCNFDIGEQCLPTYKFNRFDFYASRDSAASGFNYRFWVI